MYGRVVAHCTFDPDAYGYFYNTFPSVNGGSGNGSNDGNDTNVRHIHPSNSYAGHSLYGPSMSGLRVNTTPSLQPSRPPSLAHATATGFPGRAHEMSGLSIGRSSSLPSAATHAALRIPSISSLSSSTTGPSFQPSSHHHVTLSQPERLFMEFSRSTPGTLNYTEFVQLMRVMGMTMSGERVEQLFGYADTDGDGRMTQVEFLWLYDCYLRR